MRERIAFARPPDVGDHHRAVRHAIVDRGRNRIEGRPGNRWGRELVEHLVIRIVVKISRRIVFVASHSPEEVERLATNSKQECCRKRLIRLDVEDPNVFCENRRGRAAVLAVIDELGLDPFGWMVINDDIYGCPLRHPVVHPWNRMINECNQRIRGSIVNSRRVERVEIDIEMIDKCPVLLVRNIAV